MNAAFELLRGLQQLAAAEPDVVAAVRGRGLLCGIELRDEGYGGAIIPEMLKRGVTVAWTLNLQRVIRLEPPLVVTEREIDTALAALRAALRHARENWALCKGRRLPYVESEITIDAPAAAVYELAKNQERFPEFMPDVESVEVLERAAGFVITRWKTLVEEAPIEWTEEDRFDDAAPRIDYRLIEGDLDKFEGSWTFTNGSGGTRVVLGVDYDFGVPTLAELIGPTLEQKVRENSAMMLAALKREAEART